MRLGRHILAGGLLLALGAAGAAESARPATQPASEVDAKQREAGRIAYVMAGNRVRQGRYKDGLRYYMEALSADPTLVEAMADAALVYKHYEDFAQAEVMADRAIATAPQAPDLHHLRGTIHQAWGLQLLREKRLRAGNDHIHLAVQAYGKAIALAERQGTLSHRASTYFRLGEICYFAHADPDGARSYWQKVLSLHSPEPDLSEPTDLYRKHTYLRVRLQTWQRWAQAYLEQLGKVLASPLPQPGPHARAEPEPPADLPAGGTSGSIFEVPPPPLSTRLP